MTTTDTIHYREARPDELPDVFALGHAYFAERGMPTDYYDPNRLQEMWAALSASHLAALLTAWEDTDCVGGIGVGVFQEEYSARIYAAETFFFVKASHRGLGIDRTLLTMAETWAKTLGVSRIRLGRFCDTPKLSHYYRALGYDPISVIHEKELT